MTKPSCEARKGGARCDREPAEQHQLFNTDGSPDMKAYICAECVTDEHQRGWDWRKVND